MCSDLKSLRLVLLSALALTCVPLAVNADDKKDDKEKPAAEEAEKAPPPKKKRRPNKKAEYFRWKEASEMAAAWEQPVVMFLELEDSKECGKVRARTVGDRMFKEFVKENCIYYRCKVPKVEEPRGRRRRRTNKDEKPKPAYSEMKGDEKRLANIITEGKGGFAFPAIVVLKPNGDRLGMSLFSPEEANFTSFINELREHFTAGKYEMTIPRNVQKYLDAEAKKRAALEKRKRK